MSKIILRAFVFIILGIALSIFIRKDAHYESPSPFTNQTITPFSKNGALYLHKFHVYIVNDLPSDNVLNVHCQSKDTDKGGDRLDQSEVFKFETRLVDFNSRLKPLNLPKTSQYWCNINWDGGHLREKTFWFDRSFLEKCNFQHCVWHAEKDGLYLKTILSEDYEKVYEWIEW